MKEDINRSYYQATKIKEKRLNIDDQRLMQWNDTP